MTESGPVIGHVAMSKECYARLTPEQRVTEWQRMIAKLGVGDRAYLPVPYTDDARGITGLNIVGL